MKKKAIGEAYESIRKFNEVASQLENVNEASLALQLDLLQEEYLEGVEAFDNNDPVELLDAACDIFVITAGLMQKLESLGYNVEEALKRVTENNLTKYVPNTKENLENYPDNTYEIEINQKYNLIVYKNENGKVIKPKGFVSVEIDDCVQDEANVIPYFVDVEAK